MTVSTVELFIVPPHLRTTCPGAVLGEVKRLRAENAALRQLAYQDLLTGLWNRLAFGVLGWQLSTAAHRTAMLVDLNWFKQINDTYGHESGDAVLAMVASRLRSRMGPRWLLARLGGDEFAGLRLAPVDPAGLMAEAVDLAEVVARPMHVAGRVLRVSAAIGVAAADDVVSMREALRRADVAMYMAKRVGRPVLWKPEMGTDSAGATSPSRPGASGSSVACPAAGGVGGAELGRWRPRPLAEGQGRQWSGQLLFEGSRGVEAPAVDPVDRSHVPAADGYRPGEHVWVYGHGGWHPGTVRGVSPTAVMVDYCRAGQRGTVTDTVAAVYVMARTEMGTSADDGVSAT